MPHRTDHAQSAVGWSLHLGNYSSPMHRGRCPYCLSVLLGEIDGRLRAASDLQFLEDVFEVMPDGFVAQVQRYRDFFIGLAFSDQCQNAFFLRRQRLPFLL